MHMHATTCVVCAVPLRARCMITPPSYNSGNIDQVLTVQALKACTRLPQLTFFWVTAAANSPSLLVP
jgi:hypothetical protein